LTRILSSPSKPAHLADALAAVLLDDLVLDAAEDLDVDDDALHPRRHLERRVLHVLRLLAEDGGQQLLLGGELRLALRRDLADEDVARLHVRADAHDAALVEVDEGVLGHVRDLARDLLLPALRVAHVQLELLDVDRRVHVVLDQALESTMASSKLCPYHGMNATVTFEPSASCPCSVAAPSASTSLPSRAGRAGPPGAG
jgi:hypothetical protein